VAFALVQVEDLLGADIGPRGQDRTETRLARVQENRMRLGEHGVVQTEEYLSQDLI